MKRYPILSFALSRPGAVRLDRVVVAALFAATTFACGSSGSSSTASSTDGGAPATSNGSFSISVDDAKVVGIIGSLHPAVGNVFVDVGITLTNSGASTPIPDAFALYSLTTASALVYPASPASAGLMPACASVSVAAGGALSCRVAFEVAKADVPSQIDYADPAAGSSATAPIGSVVPLPSGSCVDWTRPDAAACSTCAEQNANGGGPCTAAFMDVRSACGVSSCSTSGYCVQVPASCSVTADCQSAMDVSNACLATACDPVCL